MHMHINNIKINNIYISLKMICLSHEQQDIIQKINNNNVIIDSVAGSGKTTTSLHIALNYPTKKILLLTYNSRLKSETRTKNTALCLQNRIEENMEVHSYHSFNTTNYDNSNYTDLGILNTIRDKKPIINKKSYDIIILDESQDITETYYRFICKIYIDTCLENNALICILGDKSQSIFDFNNADNRFLLSANKLFNFNNVNWEIAKLSISYRLTHQMVNFVNDNMLGYKRLNSIKDGKLVRYMILNIYNDYEIIYTQIIYFISLGYKYNDIFILAPSVRSNTSPVKTLANYLSIKKNIKLYVSNNDSENIDENLIKNKLVITTMHQVKGLERKIVFVTSFDYSYFKFYKKAINIDICPNEMYVACTRASEILVVIHDPKFRKMPFLKIDKLAEHYCVYYRNISDNMISEILKNRSNVSHVNLNCADYLRKDI